MSASANVVGAAACTGDAGASWWRKAYQRCVEAAKDQGRPLEEIAAERYGVTSVGQTAVI